MDINQQMKTFEEIKQLCSNYKKDGTSRKTLDYLTKRLVALENLWSDFHNCHKALVQQSALADLQYFKENIYDKTKGMYNLVKTDILQRMENYQEEQPKLTIEQDSSATGKAKELLDRQEGNMNALDRAMRKIDLDAMTQKWEMEDQLSILKNKWEIVEKLHWEIETLLRGSNEPYTNSFNTMEIKYDYLRKALNEKLHASTYYQASTPRIDLPEFTGNYNQWVSFRDLFTETIHKNPAISKVQKMQHLKGKLRGEAEKLVQHLVISSDNYDTCWEILNQRYDNQRLLFTNLMNTMMQLPTLQHPSSPAIKRMHDVINECLNGLQNIGLVTATWDPIIVYLMSQKLDSASYTEYTRDLSQPRKVPNLEEFLAFLENKFMALEAAKGHQKEAYPAKVSYGHKSTPNNFSKRQFENKTDFISKTYHTSYGRCPLCSGSHVLMQCSKFIDMDTYNRNNTIAKLKLCKNCLYSHGNEQCTSSKRCKDCNKPHHTLLHYAAKKFVAPKYNVNNTGPHSSDVKPQSSNHLANDNREVLLTTAEIQVKTITGSFISLRALLDQGSQVNLITENAAQRLRLPRKRVNAVISGVGSISGDCKGLLELECKSHCTNFTFKSDVMIIKQITKNLPSTTFETANWTHMEGLQLADPEYNVSRGIDLLLGAEDYSQILLEGVLKGDSQTPVAQQTHLGWILCGKLRTFNCHVTLFDLQDLSRFWETEDIIQQQEDMPNDEWCESFYQQETRRDKDGKYVVKMPLIPKYDEKLGPSRTIAISQFLQLERKFERQTKLAKMYKDFIQEYIDMGHMTPAKNTNLGNYVPHHGVLREHSTTTKLRSVFNASQKTIGGCSLNDVMEKGPNLQKDIQALVLLWRTYKYVYTADIEKMYRCIKLHEDQHQLLKIIWRNHPTEKLQEYELCTVTYGTKSAPWLAMRTLQQLAIDEGHKYPEAAEVLKTQFFVDDVIGGHSSLSAAKHVQHSLIELLKLGGMNLRKWCSNDPELLNNLREDQISQSDLFNFKSEETMSTKTLGLKWSPREDVFTFDWNLEENKNKLTKRRLLSLISKLYDPLGWLSPITISAKLLFQKVWETKSSWDEELSEDIKQRWYKLDTELQLIKNIKINRWLGSIDKSVQLHGFCDASEKAYACVVYSCVKGEDDVTRVTLLAARTKVVPLAQKTTLPRLELCGALLLTHLLNKVNTSLSGYDVTTYAWSDSKVVLAWLQGDNKKWERYVANRVEKITSIVPSQRWFYVATDLNPADCASRGLLPSKLVDFQLWWNGPNLIQNFDKQTVEKSMKCFYTTQEDKAETIPEKTKQKPDENFVAKLLDRKSSLTQIHRIVAWVIRFTKCLRDKLQRSNMHLTTLELKTSADYVLRFVQQNEFSQDYKQLRQNKTVSIKSGIYKLNPFLDDKGVIRVGGRLQHSILPANMKNPAIVPSKGRYTELLIDHAHQATLHGGARLTLTYIRQRHWILSGNRTVKARLRLCVRCHRFNNTHPSQLMGDLPSPRITPSRPFTHAGVDFTGSVDVKLNKGKGVRTTKAYIAIFVCMATKAVHIELVSELSTEAFMAAFQRMCSRRGTPHHMYSDNGTNFVGASRVLKSEFEVFKQLLSPEFFDEIEKLEVQWHFNAPSWPSAGGLFEAAVKSMKHHLRRVLGEQKLTWEEFTTLLAKIEACMNSRPLCPLTEDPDEFYNCLTPGHFITGSPILQLPQPQPDDRHLSLRKRWQLTEHMLEQFWKAWSNDYLTTLQTRCKWNKQTNNLQPGDVVLIKESYLPPGKWALGRVTEVHPGADGLVRVATLKTKTGILKHPIIKLSPLPTEESEKKKQDVNKQDTKIITRSNRQSGKTSKMGYSLITLLTLLFTIISGSSCTATAASMMTHITKLEPERPVYYDELGKIQLIHDEWILLMYYNLTVYWEGVRSMEIYLDHLKTGCQKITPQYCENTVNQLVHEMNLLNYYNTMLLSPHQNLSTRRKRGLINGVGYLANELFGVLDERFAEKYHKDIKEVKHNEKYLLNLVKNQTSIVELQNKALMKNEENIKRQFDSINSVLTHLMNVTFKKIESSMETWMITNYILSSSITASLLLANLRRMQETFLDTLTDIFQGHVDIHLFTPVTLIDQLTEISGHLPRNLFLPIDNIREEIKDVYRLLYVKGRITESYFLFEIHIPLVCDEDFTLYQPIPLPISIKNETANWVQVSTDFIAVNFRKNTYTSLSQEDIKHCTQKSTDNYICNAKLPIYNLHNRKAPCEAKLLDQRSTSPCEIGSARCRDDWVKLHTSNMWLIICCDKCVIRMICDKDITITTDTITSSSIVTLSQGCVVQTEELMIYSHNQFNSRAKMDPLLEIPTINSTINRVAHLALERMPQIYNSSYADFEKIEKKLVQQKDQENTDIINMSVHDIHHYTILYILVLSALVFVIVWVARKRGCCPVMKRSPTTDQQTEDIEMSHLNSHTYARVSPPKPPERQKPATATSEPNKKKGNTSRNPVFHFE